MSRVTKTEAIRIVLHLAKNCPIIFTTGYTSRIGAWIQDRPSHFYMTGSMGLSLSLGVGVCLATKRPTVVLDGDGSLLMNPGGLVAAAAHPDLPLLHLVLDDGFYESTGGQATGSFSVDLVGWARSSGFCDVHTIEDADALTGVVGVFLKDSRTPVFVRCVVEGTGPRVPPRIQFPLDSHARRFACFLGRAHASTDLASSDCEQCSCPAEDETVQDAVARPVIGARRAA